jgi:hypothetical protein
MSNSLLDDLMSRWRSDPRLTPEELCRDCPELLPRVRERLTALRTGDETGTLGPLATLPPPPTPPTRDTVSGYRILQELGRGGMGIVYLAQDLRLNRRVALKRLLPWGANDQTTRDRFLKEAEAVASLAHPHIAPIFASGEEDGQPWFVMEYVEGGTLEKALGIGRQDPVESARLVRLLARAVHHAHQKGIVHRDLKPANVLLAPPADEPALNCSWGCPKVSDFGLARRLDASGSSTAGLAVGTPSYMAPEQAEGRADVGPAADVYALGGILYRLLTGRPPFTGGHTFDVLARVAREKVDSKLQALGVPGELEAVCLKCLAKNPAERYPGAMELASALERFLAGAPVKPPAPRRSMRVALALVPGAAAVLLGVGLWLWLGGPGEGRSGAGRAGAEGGTNPGEPPKTRGGEVDPPQVKRMTVRLYDKKNPERKLWLSIDDERAMPARSGELVRVEVELDRPAHCYLLLLSSKGEVIPLFPWNDVKLKVKDADAPPGGGPVRAWSSPTKPEMGWRLDEANGLETLLLLVREAPFPQGRKLSEVLGKPPAGKGAALRDRREAAILRLDRNGASSLWDRNRGIAHEAEQVDEPLQALMRRARTVFAVVQAVRFAHVAD